MFCYSENENLSRRFSGSFDPSSFDSNRVISTHLQNYFFLKFILQKSDDPREKIQASKELTICERKINYWKRQDNFSQTRYEQDIKKFKDSFQL
jgi:hypothetical protein|tara:strand:- start:298 stop:579 length:282 start_codon:yes stop_codon:yes gene_type:complete